MSIDSMWQSGPNRTLASSFKFGFCVILCATLASSANSQSKPQSANGGDASVTTVSSTRAQLPVGADSYVIAPQDLLYIDVFDAPEFSREYRVGMDGMITVPLLSTPFKAAGTTPKQLSSAVSDALQKNNLVSDARVTVGVEESPFHTVTVTGAVTKPAIYPLSPNARVRDAITAAGGVTESAGDKVEISVASNPLRSVSLRRLLAGDADSNLELQPGETVSVEIAPVVYVTGAVNHPGAFPVRDEVGFLSVLRALALAEDAKSTAALSKAKIIRRDPDKPQHQTEIPINLKQIIAGHAPDQSLSPNDILFVPDSAGKKVAYRGAEAAVQAATGIAIFGRYW